MRGLGCCCHRPSSVPLRIMTRVYHVRCGSARLRGFDACASVAETLAARGPCGRGVLLGFCVGGYEAAGASRAYDRVRAVRCDMREAVTVLLDQLLSVSPRSLSVESRSIPAEWTA